MLPPFIIEQIRRREEDEARRGQENQPRLDLPLDAFPPRPARDDDDDDEDRGVVILDLG